MTTATMATTPGRSHLALEVAQTIRPQVDRLIVYVNGKINAKKYPGEWVMAPVGDLAAAGKFWAVPGDGYHLTVDDDLNYPADYVESIVAECNRHGGAVSYHGATVQPPLNSYFKDRTKYKVLDRVAMSRPVHIVGTGCMCWVPARAAGRLAWGIHLCPPFMVDIHFARWCEREGIKRTVLAHERGWITHKPIAFAETLGGSFHNCDRIHTWYVNRTDWGRL